MEEKQQEKGRAAGAGVVPFPCSGPSVLPLLSFLLFRFDLLPLLHPSRVYYAKLIHFSKRENVPMAL